MRIQDAIEAVILAGTELPLLLRGAEPEGLPFLGTTLIHVDAGGGRDRDVMRDTGSEIRNCLATFIAHHGSRIADRGS